MTQNSSDAATHKAARHNSAMQFLGDVTIPSY
jgi:hypothetical protein